VRGEQLIPAGHASGVFERMKAQRVRTMIAREDEDTLALREETRAAKRRMSEEREEARS
jgi:hypothetical protein